MTTSFSRCSVSLFVYSWIITLEISVSIIFVPFPCLFLKFVIYETVDNKTKSTPAKGVLHIHPYQPPFAGITLFRFIGLFLSLGRAEQPAFCTPGLSKFSEKHCSRAQRRAQEFFEVLLKRADL